MTTYIIESEYYNGDKYADKCDGIEDLLSELADIANDEKSPTIGDDAKVRTDKIKITVEQDLASQ
jgi:hypothetical protein